MINFKYFFLCFFVITIMFVSNVRGDDDLIFDNSNNNNNQHNGISGGSSGPPTPTPIPAPIPAPTPTPIPTPIPTPGTGGIGGNTVPGPNPACARPQPAYCTTPSGGAPFCSSFVQQAFPKACGLCGQPNPSP